MTSKEAIELLERFQAGKATREAVLHAFQAAPVADLGFAQVDLHRSLRKGFPEVIYGEDKSPSQVAQIAAPNRRREHRFLVTRIRPEHAAAVRRKLKPVTHHKDARCLTYEKTPAQAPRLHRRGLRRHQRYARGRGSRRHRRNHGQPGRARLRRRGGRPAPVVWPFGSHPAANVMIVVAGMEGALPSVVAGLVGQPVIAVPTSVGYGASFGGLAALLAMLNSCGSGVTVVNIDNGFGAGYAASQINALAAGELT